MTPAIQDTLLQLFEHVRQDPESLPAVLVDRWHKGSVEWRLLSGFSSMMEQVQQRMFEFKQTEEQLREREEQYRSLFEATDDGLSFNDLDGYYVEANPAYCSMYGYTREELIGLHTSVLTAPISLPVLDDALKTIKAGKGFQTVGQSLCEETPFTQAFRVAMGELGETTFHYVRACMMVPLSLRDQVIGMLVLTSSEEQAFTQHHSTLAQAIANQAAVAIENARLYEQAQELAAVEERQRLARELHDSVSQALYGISLGVHTARLQLDRDPKELAESLDYVLELAEAALIEMRALIFELRPESLETEGLVTALTKQAAALHARQNIIVNSDLCAEPDLPLKVKQNLYRVAQEALHNTVKHARASKIELRLHQMREVVILEVCDNGKGFDATAFFPGHLGLHSMQERVRHLGGELQIESAPGQGTCIHAQVPTRETM